ncbi:MAG: hypothetical protein ACRC3Y_11390, partial [Romboutsia sp.]|uniref:hypothetical protein n=1 Tax=Romboutsia sp. TaxID=1965302 RepID=UPI003F338A47
YEYDYYMEFNNKIKNYSNINEILEVDEMNGEITIFDDIFHLLKVISYDWREENRFKTNKLNFFNMKIIDFKGKFKKIRKKF